MKIHQESAAGPFAKGAEISDLSNSSAIGYSTSMNQEGGDGCSRGKKRNQWKDIEKDECKVSDNDELPRGI